MSSPCRPQPQPDRLLPFANSTTPQPFLQSVVEVVIFFVVIFPCALFLGLARSSRQGDSTLSRPHRETHPG